MDRSWNARGKSCLRGEPLSEPGHAAKRQWPGELRRAAAWNAIERARRGPIEARFEEAKRTGSGGGA